MLQAMHDGVLQAGHERARLLWDTDQPQRAITELQQVRESG